MQILVLKKLIEFTKYAIIFNYFKAIEFRSPAKELFIFIKVYWR